MDPIEEKAAATAAADHVDEIEARICHSAASFEALIESTHATREQIVEYLNCEFPVGTVTLMVRAAAHGQNPAFDRRSWQSAHAGPPKQVLVLDTVHPLTA